MKIVLASKSGVRKAILDKYGFNSTVSPSNVDEDQVKESLLEKIKEVLPQLRKDFFLDMPFQDNNEKILLVLEGLINLDLLKIDKLNMISWNQNEEEHDVAKMFSTIWLENLPS